MKRAMEISAESRALHDLLLASLTPGTHPADCAICASVNTEETPVPDTDQEIQSRIDAAVAQATASLETQITDLQGQLAERESNDRIGELQTQLDAAVAQATAAQSELEQTLGYLQALHAEQEAAREADAVREERVEAVTALNLFPGDYVEANAQRWAALATEAWDHQLDEYRVLASAHDNATPATPLTEPVRSAFTATAADTGGSKPDTAAEDLRSVLSHRRTVTGLI